MEEIKIFTVFVWRTVDGMRKVDLHLVAGLDSRDAERRIKDLAEGHLVGDVFIETDEGNSMHQHPALRLYSTRWTNNAVSEEEYTRWASVVQLAQVRRVLSSLEGAEIIASGEVDERA